MWSAGPLRLAPHTSWDRLIPALQSLPIIGLAGVASYALARVAIRSGFVGYYRYAIVAMPSAVMPTMPRTMTVREIAAEELAQYSIDVSPAVQADRFGQGMTCLGAFNARLELLGVTWVGTGSFTEDLIAVRFAVPSTSCWDTGLWVAPQHRLGRAYVALWAGTRAWMEERGLGTSYSRITDHNISSISAHRRMGARFLDISLV